MAAVKPLSIWRFRDGKPGHEQQSLGLVRALGDLTPVDVLDFDIREHPLSPLDWMLRRFPAGLAKRRPDILIGAGHSTHWAMLAARRTVGGKVVVLMKPSLPAFLFDLIVLPEHDGVAPAANILVTRGAINSMRPGEKKPDSMLMLLGGESKHAAWDSEAILQQIEAVIASTRPGAPWRIADSRRTPAPLSQDLARRYGERFQSWSDCPPGWLAQKLATTDAVWVSEDSVSMMYEALSAGCRVGILQLPGAKRDRRARLGMDRMLADGYVTGFHAWSQDRGELPAPAQPLNEARKVAQSILERWQ